MRKIPVNNICRILSEANGTVGLYIEDLSSKEIFTVNGETVFPAASTIKVPMLALLYQDAFEGKVDLDAQTEIPDDHLVGGSGLIRHLDRRFKPTVRDLARLMIVLSDNVATNEIMDIIGMERFNRFWVDWGCSSTRLTRKMMDVQAIAAGKNNFFTPADAGRILSAIAKNELISEDVSRACFNLMAGQQLQTRLPLLLPHVNGYGEDGDVPAGKVLISHKTGSNPGYVHDIGIFELPGHHRYVIAMFTGGFANPSDATQLINKVSLAVYEGLAQA